MPKKINEMRVLRVKNPKKKSKGVNYKDGKSFKPKGKKEKPAKKKDLMCRQIGKATVCFDKSKPKRHDKKKVKPRKKKPKKK
jgi:hypothetical protein